MDEPRAGVTLWLTDAPRAVPAGDVDVVVDLRWTPAVGGDPTGARSLREAAGRVLARVDPLGVTSDLLDEWADASGVAEALTIGTTSFWYRQRLGHWLWLQERVLWAELLAELLDEHAPSSIVLGDGADDALRAVASLVTAARGVRLRVDGPPAMTRRAGIRPGADGLARPLGRLARRALGAVLRQGPRIAASRAAAARLARLTGQAGSPLLVVLTQLPQRIETPSGARVMNPNVGPIVDELRGSALDPVIVDRYADRARRGAGADRVLPLSLLRSLAPGPDRAARAAARSVADEIGSGTTAAPVAGIDLGPALARHVADDAATWLAEVKVAVERWRRLAERLHARAFLVADEYHRQDCLEAAARLGIPVAAIQHGTIYRRHNGYVHRNRPAVLRLPARTYVFGRWERDLLVRDSVYRNDEVMVGGSPRQDLFHPASIDREGVRAELGVEPGERLVVVSGTYGVLYRRFQYPLLLARLFDRPLPGIRVVVKQHPAERDEGPYGAVIEGVAAAGGFEPPPVHVVRDVDLYRVLAAADAHLGIHSTVLTEAVFVGTPNLLATGILGGDLLDYVAAGVALPVVDGADMLRALDAAADGAITSEARATFIASHYEPGQAGRRIADDLLAWLA